jgi:crotonobetainyl-CoA:carnitine CoA-transferase CaiB-like acyl-CoA transferase
MMLPTAIPRMSQTPPRFSHAGPALGEHTDQILHDILQLDEHEIARLRGQQAI